MSMAQVSKHNSKESTDCKATIAVWLPNSPRNWKWPNSCSNNHKILKHSCERNFILNKPYSLSNRHWLFVYDHSIQTAVFSSDYHTVFSVPHTPLNQSVTFYFQIIHFWNEERCGKKSWCWYGLHCVKLKHYQVRVSDRRKMFKHELRSLSIRSFISGALTSYERSFSLYKILTDTF